MDASVLTRCNINDKMDVLHTDCQIEADDTFGAILIGKAAVTVCSGRGATHG